MVEPLTTKLPVITTVLPAEVYGFILIFPLVLLILEELFNTILPVAEIPDETIPLEKVLIPLIDWSPVISTNMLLLVNCEALIVPIAI